MYSPIESHVIVLALCLLIMLIVPPVCKRIGMPSIFGLVIAGILVGPKGFHFIEEGSGIELFATAGLLYLMFLAALEIDMSSFRKNKFKSITFGILTFIIPFVSGFVASRYLFGYGMSASLLLACMFSTHTLVSYPIASRLNITKTEPVVISIGGTIITDMAVLLLLTIITASYQGSLNFFFWAKTIILLAVFVWVLLWIFPRIIKWYFAHFQSDETAQYTFILCSLFVSGFLSELAGIEPIVGAFLCGLALNRAVPQQSTLMNRTAFIGNTLFIPFFLIYIGMLVDFHIFLKGIDTLLLAAVLIIVALLGKYLAALIVKLAYRYSRSEYLLLFGLTSSHAAATIAVVLVGYNIGIFNDQILNASVLIILFTCLISAYCTDYAGRRVALQQIDQDMIEYKADKILVPVSNPDTVKPIFDFALLIHRKHVDSVVYPLSVATTQWQLDHSMLKEKPLTDYFTTHSESAGVKYFPITRIDSNISEGIIRASAEMQVTHIVMGWSGQSYTAKYFFGTIIDNLLTSCRQTILVTRLLPNMMKFRKIYALVPRNADHETGFYAWLTILMTIQKRTSSDLLFIGDKQTLGIIAAMKETNELREKNYRVMDDFPSMSSLAGELTETDLFWLFPHVQIQCHIAVSCL